MCSPIKLTLPACNQYQPPTVAISTHHQQSNTKGSTNQSIYYHNSPTSTSPHRINGTENASVPVFFFFLPSKSKKYTSLHVYIYTKIHTQIHTYTHTFSLYVYMYTYIFIYMHTIHTYVHRERRVRFIF